MWLFRGKPALIRWTIIQFVFISISVILKKHSIREYSVYHRSYFSFIILRATGRFHNSWQNVILWLPETCHLPYKHPGKKRNPQNPGCGRRGQAFPSGVIIRKTKAGFSPWTRKRQRISLSVQEKDVSPCFLKRKQGGRSGTGIRRKWALSRSTSTPVFSWRLNP